MTTKPQQFPVIDINLLLACHVKAATSLQWKDLYFQPWDVPPH